MKYRLLFQLCFGILLLVTTPLLAQHDTKLPYNPELVDYDNEEEIPGVEMSVELPIRDQSRRGVRGADNIVYWVTDDKQYLIAYKANRALWKTNVVKPCLPTDGTPEIQSIALEHTTIDVRVGDDCRAQVNRKNGQVVYISKTKLKKS